MTAQLDKKLLLLHFKMQDTLACINLKNIEKILLLPSLEEVPGGPVYMVGLMNLHGQSVTVIDLLTLIGIKREKSYSLETPLLICSENSIKIAVVVDEVLELMETEEKVLQYDDKINAKNSPFMAIVPYQSKLSYLININRILGSEMIKEKQRVLEET